MAGKNTSKQGAKKRQGDKLPGEAKIVAQFGGEFDPAAAAFADHAPIILDVAGTTLNAADRRRLAHPLTGGAILFARDRKSVV